MKAVFIRRYGGPDVVELGELAQPVPRPGEVLVRVRASSVNPIDWKIRNGALKLFVRHPFPMIVGVDVAGEVVALGEGARRFKVGDAIYAMTPHDLGAFAELVALPEAVLAHKPARLGFEQAGAIPAVASTALQALRDKAQTKAGEEVLINGASGGVGVFAVQLAKLLGGRVTAVCSGANAALVQRLGADAVIDYREVDFTRGPRRYDVIFDCVGNRPFAACRNVLSKNGRYVSTESAPGLFLRSALNVVSSRKAIPIIVKARGTDLEYLARLIDEGRLEVVIDRTFPLARIRDALAYSETGRARGKIVITVGSEEGSAIA